MDIFNLASIATISNEPEDKEQFKEWIEQSDVCSFLEKEIDDDFIILYAAIPFAFIHSVLIPQTEFYAADIEDLLKWDVLIDATWGEVYSSDSVWIEPPLSNSDSDLLCKGEKVVFSRQFDGASSDRHYYELAQKFTHILDIHFVPERNAWCKLDRLGDVEEVVKILDFASAHKMDGGTIIAIQKRALERYTTLTDSTVLRMFDFTRYKTGSFNGWHKGIEKPLEGDNVFGRLVVEPGYGSYARGVQIADLRFDKQILIDEIWNRPTPKSRKQYASFVAHDWKHDVVAEISCDPSQLGNYFVVSDLPHGLSPAFFRPEVLSKYKTDRGKYQLKSRSLSCRGAWELKTFDINDAGQVHTYLIYLSHLPLEEQLHWKQFNEEPKGTISARAYKTDFEGSWDEEYGPLEGLKRKLYALHEANTEWWKLRDPYAIDKVNYPYTTSKDEWADEIMNLDQLLVEGLEGKWLKRKAEELGRPKDDRFRSLKLLEECLVGAGFEPDHAREIMGVFHDAHNLRSKVKGHTSGQEAAQIKKNVLREFGSFRKHFENLCARCDENLEIIINALRT